MNHIAIYDQSVVIVIGGKKAPFAEVLDKVPATPFTWNINDPENSRENLRDLVKNSNRVRVIIKNAHAKSVREAIAVAHKHGSKAHLLRLDWSPDIGDGAAKADSVHDVKGADGLFFSINLMPSNKNDLEGPFDMIGDIHGAADELRELLTKLGHMENDQPVVHPEGRIPVFLGDYTDRGPKNKEALEIVRAYTEIGGLAILGNHDDKLMRWLEGRNINIAAGIAITIEELSKETPEWRADMAQWLKGLETHYLLADGQLVVAHAGIEEEHHGRHTKSARSAALYGKPIDGGTVLDEDGYPAAEDWAQNYSGKATVVHGHVVYGEPRVLNNVVAVDTGAVFGGSLTAYRWPEKTFVSVKAKKTYYTHPRISA